MAMEVKTWKFEWSHGRKPRGYGLWAFELPDGRMLWEQGNYGEAKRAAVQQARDLKVPFIYVAP